MTDKTARRDFLKYGATARRTERTYIQNASSSEASCGKIKSAPTGYIGRFDPFVDRG